KKNLFQINSNQIKSNQIKSNQNNTIQTNKKSMLNKVEPISILRAIGLDDRTVFVKFDNGVGNPGEITHEAKTNMMLLEMRQTGAMSLNDAMQDVAIAKQDVFKRVSAGFGLSTQDDSDDMFDTGMKHIVPWIVEEQLNALLDQLQ
ncbi:hypothetical protein RFI_12950, partial [Reticulomyxa filosa]